jgi:hypothetical protein
MPAFQGHKNNNILPVEAVEAACFSIRTRLRRNAAGSSSQGIRPREDRRLWSIIERWPLRSDDLFQTRLEPSLALQLMFSRIQ